MFKKQATYKSATAIRNSDRKTLVADVRRLYALAFEEKSEEEIKEIVDLILPSSGIEASAFSSTKGHRGTLYSHNNVAIFIKFETHLVPTLHTLWKYSALTTTALTGAQVLSNLQAGSDLMVKGMFEYSSRVKSGEAVGIRITGGKSKVIAVGLAAVDFDKVDRVAGGKGLLLVTCLGDTITPESAYPTVDEAKQDATELSQALTSVVLGKQETDVKADQLEKDEEDNKDVQQDSTGLSTSEIDAAFSQALLYGLHGVSGAQQEISLPMPSSSLVDAHVLPFLPLKHPDLVFKKTSWKKASKFLTKQKFLKTKETKGQLTITGIDWHAAEITSFVPYKLPTTTTTHNSTDPRPDAVTEERRVIEVEELYKPPSSMKTLLGVDAGSIYHKSEISGMLDKYYLDNELITENPKMITIDPELFHTIVPKTSAQKELSRDVLLRSLIRGCVVHHRINGGKIKKGPVPDLEIVMESRQGKKSVTRVLHLERFFSPPDVDLIMDELKKKCAVSVSIGEVKGTKPGSSVEVMVQGKKSTEVIEVLEAWGVRKTWIKAQDKTK